MPHGHRTCSADGCQRPWLARKLCSKHYEAWRRAGGVKREGRIYCQTAEDAIRTRAVRSESGCLLWTGGTSRGYGRISVGGRLMAAHRAAWTLVNGPIPSGMFVCHSCDTPACVNIEHLFLGTPADNMRDMVRKGRGRSALGSAHPGAKLTEDYVREILKAPSTTTSAELARRFGVSGSLVRSIRTRKQWRHIDV